MFGLYPYQREAVDAVLDAWGKGVTRVAVVLPTGGGKTITFAQIVRQGLDRLPPGGRALVVAHRIELIEQAAAKLREQCPRLRVGICMGTRRGEDNDPDIVVASVQTLASERRRSRIRDVRLVVIDEAHHATAPTYRAVLEHYGCMRDAGATPAVGLSATLMRGDSAMLGDIWQDVVYERKIVEMINEGFLVRPTGRRVYVADLDLRKVKSVRGDYADGDLGRAIEGSLAPEVIASAYREHAADRQGVVFCPTVHSAQVVAGAIESEGFTVGMVHGGMAREERALVLKKFRRGDIQVLNNCMVLTEGTDLPMIGAVVVARPTKSQGLYLQMVGRGLRLWCPTHGAAQCAIDGIMCAGAKKDCLVLDVVGASTKHSLSCSVSLFGEEIVGRQREAEEELDAQDADELASEYFEFASGGGPGGFEDAYIYGPIASTEIDLFHGSGAQWERTAAGVRFICAGERFIALLPSLSGGADIDVVALDKYERGKSTFVQRGVADLAYAMAYAEAAVTREESMMAQRGRSWRAKKASDKQKSLAERYGVVVREDMRSGEVSSLINAAMATRRIDWHPVVAARVGTR